MSTKVEREESKQKNLKIKKILLFSGLALAGLELIASIVLIVILGRLTIIPRDYVIMVDILLVLICLVVVIAQRWVVAGIVAKVISLLLTIVIIVASVYLNITYKVFNRTTGVDYKTTTVGVYVLATNEATTMEEIKHDTFGIISELDRVNTDEAISDIQSRINQGIKTSEYADAQALVTALYDGEVNVIILNESFIGVVENIERFADFKQQTKQITSFKKTEQIEEPTKGEDYLDSDEVITIYVSGVDLEGPPTANQNSDVNIIISINKKTHQIFLLNTPRDFYVPLSISNGIPDKLTHAGIYGVDVSVGTLEMLYGIDIDYYIKLNFTGFVSIIDALGGVDVYSEFEFVSYHGNDHFVVGYNHMNGKQALGFARERYAFKTGDNQRGRNQMAVITAIIKKMASSELLKNYTEVINSIASCMVTNMTMDDIGALVDLQLKENISWDIVQFAVGGRGEERTGYSFDKKNYVMIPDEYLVNVARVYLAQFHDNQVISIGG